MQPTEETSTPDVHESQAEPEASPATEEQASPSWWQRVKDKIPSLGTREESEPSTEESAADGQRTLTDEEVQRLVQAETDRREAARNKAFRDEERKRLRDEDPWEYAEQERAAEAAAQQETQLNDLLQGFAQAHDKVTLIPLLDTLPEPERNRVLALPGAGQGAEGRELITREAMKSLEKHWRDQGAKDAEQKLRRNPSFRKQVLAEMNGGISEPDILPPLGHTPVGWSTDEVNDMLRQQVGLRPK